MPIPAPAPSRSRSLRGRRPPTPKELLIPIQGRPTVTSLPAHSTDPYTYWFQYYSSKDPRRANPAELHETLRLLNQSARPREVHAALMGYLKNHPDLAEPWMYEALALAVEMNRGSEADVKTALNYAADLAQQSHNPNALVSVADTMFLKGYFERVGPLLDEAAAKLPHRSEPLVMSINVARKMHDPKRMADSIERLLSLGWPGADDYFRMESRNQVQLLARLLIEENRKADADLLIKRLAESEARDLYIHLNWDGEADFDLNVDEPLGATACYQTPRTVFGGAIVKQGYGSHPDEIYTCPRAFNGEYVVRVSKIWANPQRPTTRLTLEIVEHEGTEHEQKQVHHLDPDNPEKTFKVQLTQGRRTRVLPYIDPAAAAIEVLAKELKPKGNTRPDSGKSASKVREVKSPQSSQPAHPAIKVD